MPSLFARKSSNTPAAAEADKPASAKAAPSGKARTPSKEELGVATPKRRETVRRTVEKPPEDRREAAKRAREKNRQHRIEQREGMARGDDQYLLARDRGPERRLARDLVDSRRTIGTWFFGTLIVVMLVSFSGKALNGSIYLAAQGLFLLMLLATIADSVLISRQLKKLLHERFPDSTVKPRSLFIYASMRAISFRGIRSPKPQVKLGDKI